MAKRNVDTTETVGARIPLREMVVDAEYQGHVSEHLVEKIAKQWNESAAGAIILNLRDDNTYAVLDGQHRVLAAKQCGVQELNALVFIGKSRQEEASLFVQLNTKHNVRPFDRFRANLLAGKLEEKNIMIILRELGLKLSSTPSRVDGGLQCIVGIKSVYQQFGPAHLKLVLGVLEAAFKQYPDKHRGLTDQAVIGTSQFVFRYPEADTKKLITRLGGYSPTTIQGIAITKIDPGQSKWIGWGRAITGIYNYGVRSTSANYLPNERWSKKTYTPSGKEAKTAGPGSFKVGHVSYNKGMKMAAKTTKKGK